MPVPLAFLNEVEHALPDHHDLHDALARETNVGLIAHLFYEAAQSAPSPAERAKVEELCRKWRRLEQLEI